MVHGSERTSVTVVFGGTGCSKMRAPAEESRNALTRKYVTVWCGSAGKTIVSVAGLGWMIVPFSSKRGTKLRLNLNVVFDTFCENVSPRSALLLNKGSRLHSTKNPSRCFPLSFGRAGSHENSTPSAPLYSRLIFVGDSGPCSLDSIHVTNGPT